jgi:hypothetical protein
MESKKMNVTEEWLLVITQLTLSYRSNRNQRLKCEDQIADTKAIASTLISRDEIKLRNQIF